MIRTKQIERKDMAPEVKQVLQGALSNPLLSMRALTKDKLYYFIQYFWDTYSNDKFQPNWHIEVICNELEQVARRVAANQKNDYDLIINVPPGSTKTAMVSIFFPVWCWVNWYWMKFITTSHSSGLSLESAEYSRDIITSEKFKQLFPEIELKQDKEAKSNFRVVKKEWVIVGQAPRLKYGGGRVSTSVDARITGFHAHIIIPDDLIDPKRALSETGLTTANNHIDHTLSTRKTDKKVSTMIMIMQRLHQNDPTGHIIKKRAGKRLRVISLPGEIVNYKAQLQPPEFEKYYTEDGLMDPNRLGWEELKTLEADLGQYAFAGQVGQNPTPPGGGMFKVDNFQVIDYMPEESKIKASLRYWDKAGTDAAKIKKGEKRAFTAGVRMHFLNNGKILISHVKRGQWGAEVREAIIKNIAQGDDIKTRVYIEQEPGSGGKESAEATIRNLIGYFCEADHPSGDKIYRADPYSVAVNNGDVWLLKGDWNHEFIEEHRFFPFSQYKDQVDAAAAGFAKLTRSKTVRVI